MKIKPIPIGCVIVFRGLFRVSHKESCCLITLDGAVCLTGLTSVIDPYPFGCTKDILVGVNIQSNGIPASIYQPIANHYASVILLGIGSLYLAKLQTLALTVPISATFITLKPVAVANSTTFARPWITILLCKF